MKALLKLIFILFVLVVIAGLVFFFTFDINSYRDKINQELSAALDRPVTIGQLDTKLAFVPTIRAMNVVIANPKNIKEKGDFVKIDELEFTLEIMPLIVDKNVRIHNIAIQKAEINIINKKTQNNIDFSSKSGGKGGSSSFAFNPYLNNLKVGSISFNQVDIRYVDDEKTQTLTLRETLIRQLKMISFLLDYNKQEIRFTGNMDLMKLIQQQSGFVFNADIEAFGFISKISGNIGDMKQLKNILLNVNLETNSLRDSMVQVGIKNNNIPSYPMQLSTIIKGSAEKLNFENTTIQFDDVINITVKGSVSNVKTDPTGKMSGTITLNKPYTLNNITIKPMTTEVDISVSEAKVLVEKFVIAANRSDSDIFLSMDKKDKAWFVSGSVISNYLDVNDLFTIVYADPNQTNKTGVPAKQQIAQPAQTEKNDTEKRDVSSLIKLISQINGQIDWNLKNVKFVDGMEDYYGIVARTTLDKNTLTANPLQIKMAAGVLNGVVQVKNVSTVPQTQLNLQGNNIALDKIKFFNFKNLLVGSTANVDAKLSAEGLTKESLLSSLNGTTEIEVTRGKVVNKWFNGIPDELGLAKKTKSVTFTKSDMDGTLNCAVANVKITNGLINIDKSVAVETSVLNALVSGSVNLTKDDVSVSVLPEISSQLFPVLLFKGKVGSLKFEGVDAKSTLSNVIKEGLNQIVKSDEDSPDFEAESNVTPKVSWCEMALGHKLKGKVVVQEKPEPAKEVQKEAEKQVEKVKLTPQEELKQQLIKSLSSALNNATE